MKNNKFINYIKDILPGFLVSVAVALVGIFIAKFVPKLGAGTISIFLGMFVGNLFLIKILFFKGDISFRNRYIIIFVLFYSGGTLSINTL